MSQVYAVILEIHVKANPLWCTQCISVTYLLMLWENEIVTMKDDKSYHIGGIVVREFKIKKFLPTVNEGSFTTKKLDISQVDDAITDNGCHRQPCITATAKASQLVVISSFIHTVAV